MNDYSHESVMSQEAIKALKIQPADYMVDGTFGRGGHSRAILSHLGREGRLLAIDRDPAAIRAASAINDERFSIIQDRFSSIDRILEAQDIKTVDGILLDLGVSSPQLDDHSRGFTFRADAFLDMRMDPTQGESAAEWLNRASAEDIQHILRNYGEERFAKQIASAIVSRRSSQRLDTTGQLAELVASVVWKRERGKNPATRTFQAIRIFINRELEELQIVLPKAFEALRIGGRLVVISFHSLEDRIVKRFMREKVDIEPLPRDLPLRTDQLPAPKARWIVKRAQPSLDEVQKNPRSRSAVLRAIEKLAD